MIHILLTPKLMDALEGSAFALECPKEMRMGRAYITSGYMYLTAAEAGLLIQSINEVLPGLHPSVRRAAEERLKQLHASIAVERRWAEMMGEPEAIKSNGEIALGLLKEQLDDRASHHVADIEQWAEYDPDVREHAGHLRDAFARLQDAVDKLSDSV